MRYYVVAIQHNKNAGAENRTAPKGFDTIKEAEREFYYQLSQDMNNNTLDWGICLIFNSEGGVLQTKKWADEPAQTPAE